MSAPLPKRVSRKGTAQTAKVKQRTWSPQEVALVERLRGSGLTYGQIACRIGVSANSIGSLFRNRITPPLDTSCQITRWRIRQLLTAGYGPREAAEWIGAPLTLALDEFTRWEDGK